MNLAAVQSAELLDEGSVAVVMVIHDSPMLRYALAVARKLRYHLSLGKDDQSIVESATPG